MSRVSVVLDLRVRRCRAGDLAALEWYGIYAAHRSIIRAAFERQQAGEVDMLVADLRGFPAAQVWIDRAQKWRERTGIIWAVRVFPLLRGLGIGTAMMAEAEALLRDHSFAAAELGVEKDNAGVRSFYERRGYREAGELCERYTYELEDGTVVEALADQWLLRKELRG